MEEYFREKGSGGHRPSYYHLAIRACKSYGVKSNTLTHKLYCSFSSVHCRFSKRQNDAEELQTNNGKMYFSTRSDEESIG